MKKKEFFKALTKGAVARCDRNEGILCCFGGLDRDGRSLVKPFVCHAALSEVYDKTKERGIDILASSIAEAWCRGDNDANDVASYYQWLVKDSPFSAAALYVEDRVLVVNPEANKALVGALCVASRMPWEFPTIFKGWLYWRDKGYPESIAFLVAHQQYQGGKSNHLSIDSGDMAHKVVSFCKGKHEHEKSWWESKGSYRGFTKGFWGVDRAMYDNLDVEEVKEEVYVIAPWGRGLHYIKRTEFNVEVSVEQWYSQVKDLL